VPSPPSAIGHLRTIAAGIALVAFAFLSESRRPEGTRHLDVAGAVTATGGLAAFIYALVGTDTHPWGSSHTLSFLGLAVFLIATFVFIETRVARQPLVPFRVFRSRSLMGANVVMLLAGGVFFAMWYFLSLFMQDVLGYDALKAGIAFLPMGIAVAVGAQISSRLLRRLSIRTMLLITTPIGAAGFFWVSRITDHSGYWTALFGPGLMLSLSLGLLFTPLASAATAGVQQSEAGLASGILNTSRQLGGSIGLAALATIAAQRTGSLITAHGTRPSMGAALTSGYSRAFVVAGFIAVVAFAASFIVPNRPPAGRGRAPEESKQTAPIEPAIGGGLALATETVLSNGANPTKRDIGSN